jgi:tetratricopeptide (TPR) repeat protein
VKIDLNQVARSPRSLVVLVAVSLGALFSVTTLLGSYYHEAKVTRADRHFAAAASLAASRRLDDATREFRAGLALERDNLEGQRGLALALLSLGRHAEAATYFDSLLRREPTNGPANRGMARVAAAQNRPIDATVYYQRAIYGQWPDDMPEARIETRFELVDHLRRFDNADPVRAELLRLKTDVPPDRTATHRRIAQLLADTGASEEAIESLRTAAAAAPRDVGVLADLAAIQTTAGRWLEARATLRRALAIERRDDLRERLALVDRILVLDPTRPRLRMVERTRRARRVLAAVVDETAGCAGPEAAALRAEAQRHLRRPGHVDAEAAERDLDLATRLWAAAPACRADTTEARALTHVLGLVSAPEQQES